MGKPWTFGVSVLFDARADQASWPHYGAKVEIGLARSEGRQRFLAIEFLCHREQGILAQLRGDPPAAGWRRPSVAVTARL